MNATRISFTAVASIALAGCGSPALVGMKPAAAERNEVRWSSGAPILRASGTQGTVAVSPLADAAGRHEVGARLPIFVLVRNASGAPREISETNVSVALNGAGVLVYPAAAVDRNLRESAAAAQTADAVVAAFLAWEAGGAPGAAPPPTDRAALARFHGALGRTVIEPGGLAGGFVVADTPRELNCAEHTPTGSRSGLCTFQVLVQFAGDSHVFLLEETR